MKKKRVYSLIPAMVILGLMSLTVAVSAEENGYWTSRVDEQGNTAQIFVYTEPVEWEYSDDASLGHCDLQAADADSAAEPIAVTDKADRRLAGAVPETGAAAAGIVQAESPAPSGAPEHALYGIAAFGVLILAGLGYALYKAV